MPLRLGTRTSRLAIWQANWIASELHRLGVAVDIEPVVTSGDVDDRPVAELGTVGVFTKEIQRALLENRIDLAVHCLKDLPTVAVPELSLAAIPARESAFDCLVAREDNDLAGLRAGACVGTGSVRRRAQLLRVRPDLQVVNVRGNVDTRLRKLDAGEFDALILAEAGLVRLARKERISQVFDVVTMVPAPGQGALAIETRVSDQRTQQAVRALDDPLTRAATEAERAMMRALGGGCDAPIGVHAAALSSEHFHLVAVVLSQDGQVCLRESAETSPEALPGEALDLAQRMVDRGAVELLR